MFKFNKNYRKLDPNPEPNSGGGGNPNNPGNPNQQNNQNPNNQNNSTNNPGFWDNNNQGGQPGNNQQQPQNGNQNQQQNFDYNQAFQQHVQSLGIGANIDVNQIANDMQQGNMESFQQALAQVGQDAYTAAIKNANKLMQSKIDEAVDKAVSKSRDSVNEDMAVKQLHSELPFTSDPDIQPMAETALKHQLGKGKTVAEAIQAVNDLFSNTAKKVMGNNPGNAPGGSPGSQNFNHNNGTGQHGQNDNEPDWLNLLKQDNADE